MSLPQMGKIYTFTCMVFPDKKLNLYGSAAKGKNVVLWESDGSVEQQWKYDLSGKLLTMRDTSYALDRYAALGTQYNNADVWPNDPDEDANQILTFEETTFPNTVKIRLASTNLYLQANIGKEEDDGNGKGSQNSTTSPGNVYWDVSVGEDNELWVFSEVATQSEQGNGNGTLIVGSRPSTLNYNSDCYGRRFDEGQCTWHAFGRAIEVTGKTITFSASYGLHAKTWWNYVTNCTKGSTPRANSIAVWDDGGAYGHVAYVEKVFDDGTVYYTEANWKGTLNVLDAEDGKVRQKSTSAMATRTTSNGTVYRLLGYLYL